MSMSPAIQNLLETFNADIGMACKDGAEMHELVGIAGAITESLLRAVTPKDRLRCWVAITTIMDRKFNNGEI